MGSIIAPKQLSVSDTERASRRLLLAEKERRSSRVEYPIRPVLSRPSFACMPLSFVPSCPSACLPVWVSSPGNPAISFAILGWVSPSFLSRHNETSEAAAVSQGKGPTLGYEHGANIWPSLLAAFSER